MNYEKAYKEALERAKQFSENPLLEDSGNVVEYIFPELKESEDEKIRKELIKVFSNREKYLIDQSFGDITVSEVLAWLEKQGEKLPVGFYYVNSEGKKFYSDTFKYGDVILHVEKQDEQKPAWGEEDEAFLNTTIAYLKDANEFKKTAENCIDWLKSLKQRIGG